jgi:exodeoxyribonuclease V alpha subunit
MAATNSTSEFPGFLRRLFPEAGPELLRLYASAAEDANLLHTDFYTIRDLLDLSGYADQEALHALLLVLLLALDEGSLCVEASETGLDRRLAGLTGGESWAARIAASLRSPGFPGLIGEQADGSKPVVLHRQGDKQYLYFQKYLKHEMLLHGELLKRLEKSGVAPIFGGEALGWGQPPSPQAPLPRSTGGEGRTDILAGETLGQGDPPSPPTPLPRSTGGEGRTDILAGETLGQGDPSSPPTPLPRSTGGEGRKLKPDAPVLGREGGSASPLAPVLGGEGLGVRGPSWGDLRPIVHQVLADSPLRLNKDQQAALAVALLRNFVIISGGPGTGKTSIIFTLLRCLLRCGVAPERIALAAPTGRAAQRLTDAVRNGLDKLPPPRGAEDVLLEQITGRTLHQLLGYRPSRGVFRHHAENPLPMDVVIVDEVSMVGVVLMAQLFQALLPQTKLILLGDKDQLASVDAGAVLANLVEQGGKLLVSEELSVQVAELVPGLKLTGAVAPHLLRDIVVGLEENYRSQRHIQEVARALNDQDVTIVDQLPGVALGPELSLAHLEEQGGCRLLEQTEAGVRNWRRALEQWADYFYLQPAGNAEAYADLVTRCRVPGSANLSDADLEALHEIFVLLGRARILTLLREGPWGCLDINQFLEQYLRPRLDRAGRGSVFAGAPVLITSNDYNRQLFNGDVGVTLRSTGGGYRVVFQRQGGALSFPADALTARESAFALTVHKAQGSEYGNVLLALPPEGGRRLLTKELVYTGITRAKNLAILCATKDALRTAVGRRIDRESALLNFTSPTR